MLACSQIARSAMRTYSTSCYVEPVDKPKTKSTARVLFVFGLPDRIRTYGLQSRSLTRYPAVPRVDKLFINIFYGKPSEFAARDKKSAERSMQCYC